MIIRQGVFKNNDRKLNNTQYVSAKDRQYSNLMSKNQTMDNKSIGELGLTNRTIEDGDEIVS